MLVNQHVRHLNRAAPGALPDSARPEWPTPPKVDRRTIPEAHEVSLLPLVAVQLHSTVRFPQLLPTGMLWGWGQAIITYSRIHPVPRCCHMVRQRVKTYLT